MCGVCVISVCGAFAWCILVHAYVEARAGFWASMVPCLSALRLVQASALEGATCLCPLIRGYSTLSHAWLFT